MRFYSYKDVEGVIHLEVTPFSYGYFYEAKDLTKHPFLNRYGEDLYKRMIKDRSLNSTLVYYRLPSLSILADSLFPTRFAELIQELINRTIEGQGIVSNVDDLLDENEIQGRDISKHFKWFVLKYLKGGIPVLEDMPHAVERVAMYEALKKGGFIEQQYYDLNKFRSVFSLSAYITKIWDQSTKGEISPDRIQKLIRSGELEIYYEDSTMVVYNILSSKACELTGSADWCTTRGAFNNYKKDGDLYTVHIKGKPDERYHLSFARFEFTDENNNPLHSLAVKQLSLDSVFKGSIFDKSATKHRQEEIIRAGSDENIWLEDVLDIMDANQKELYVAIETYPEMLSNLEMDAQIDFLVDHNELVDYATHGAQKKFIGVEGYWEAIRYIKKPDLGLQTAAIDHSPEALGLIDDPDWRAQEYHDSVWPIEDEDREDDF